MKNIFNTIKAKASAIACRGKALMASTRGEGYVDTGLKILIAVVIGALLLAGLYTLFGSTILPTLTQKVKDLFNFKG